MKLKDFKEMISSLPEEFDDFDVIYSDIEENDEDSYLRTDDILVGMVSDDQEKKMCFMGEDSYKIALYLYSDTEEENNNEENEENDEQA